MKRPMARFHLWHLFLLFLNCLTFARGMNDDKEGSQGERVTFSTTTATTTNTTTATTAIPPDIVALIPGRDSVFRNEIHNALRVTAKNHRATIEIDHFGNYDPELTTQVLDKYLHKSANEQPRGYIIWPYAEMVSDWAKSLHELHPHIPIVQFNTLPREQDWDNYLSAYVGYSEMEWGRVSAQNVIQIMNQKRDVIHNPRVAIIAFPEHHHYYKKIMEGFRQVISSQSQSNNRVTVVDPIVHTAATSQDDAYLATVQLMEQAQQSGQPVHAIFCMDDTRVSGVYQALKDMGKTPGQDVEIIGAVCNGSRSLLESREQAFTTVVSPFLIGSQSIISLLSCLGGTDAPECQANRVRDLELRVITGDTWETTFVEFDGEQYAVDQLCTWTLKYESESGLNSIDQVQNVCDMTSITCNYIPPGYFWAGYAMVSMNYALALVGAVLLFYYRRKKIIQLAQPFFLGLVLVGSMVDTTSILFMSKDNRNHTPQELDAACFAWPWLFALGHMMTTATLVSKIHRVAKVCMPNGTTHNLKKTKVTLRQASIFVIVFMALDAIVLLTWYLVDPMRWTMYVSGTDSNGYIVETTGKCHYQHDSSVAFPIVLGCLHLGVLLYANLLAYKTRKLHQVSDSRYVAVALFNSIGLLLVATPIVISAGDVVEFSYLSRVTFVFLNNFWVILLVVYTKLWTCLKGKGDKLPNLHMARHGSSVRLSDGMERHLQKELANLARDDEVNSNEMSSSPDCSSSSTKNLTLSSFIKINNKKNEDYQFGCPVCSGLNLKNSTEDRRRHQAQPDHNSEMQQLRFHLVNSSPNPAAVMDG